MTDMMVPTNDFDIYQERCVPMAAYPNPGSNIVYTVLGLCGEAGEVAEKVKKWIRDGTDLVTLQEQVARELGDVLWYISMSAWELGYTLSDIAEMNIKKLQDRIDRGTHRGSGDNR